MAIKAVFFDAAGTLMKPARGVGESYSHFAAGYGVEVAPSALAERFRVCFGQAPRLAFPGVPEEAIALLEKNWWKDVVARVFEPWRSFEKFDEFFDELFAYFADPRAWTLYPEVLQTLAALRQRGVRASVISNFDSRLLAILNGLGIAGFFEEIFVSSRIGYAKPDAEIFHAAIKHLGLPPQQAVHVGDSEINDLHGANNAGLRGILVDRRTQAGDHQRITSLSSILELVQE
jgi:putative hydrolase of the HAD superfamily